MKDKDNVMRLIDEVDNSIMIIDQAVERKLAIAPDEARRRFTDIRRKLKIIMERVSTS